MKTNIGTFRSSIFIFLLIVLNGCSSYSDKAFKGYEGGIQPSENLSTIRMGKNVEWLKASGHKINHKEFAELVLKPDMYEIEWGTEFNVSVLVKSSGKDKRIWSGIINLRPGYTYTIYADRSVGIGYVVFSWVEDSVGEKIGVHAKQIWAE